MSRMKTVKKIELVVVCALIFRYENLDKEKERRQKNKTSKKKKNTEKNIKN